jgi:hypothetical protein
MNYYNYFTEIEDTFVRRRGKHLFLSPMDWALMETWKQQEIPLHLVLRGVERAFDSFESKPRKRSVKSLLYCQEEVEAQYAEWLEARVGANPQSESRDEKDETTFSRDRVCDHLRHSSRSFSNLARTSPGDRLAETFSRVSNLLEAIEADFASGATVDTRKLEDSLTGLERMLNEALVAAVPVTTLDRINKEITAQLKPYRSQMEPKAYQQTFANFQLKRLREDFGVPRLSLFYL